MNGSSFSGARAPSLGRRALAAAIAWLAILAANTSIALAQPAPAPGLAQARVVVNGEGSVSVAPDLALIRTGVTTRADTVKEASDANAKTMAAVMAALSQAGIASNDIQTASLTVQPVYAAPDPHSAQKIVGYRVANQVSVKIHQIDQVGPVIDRLVAAGATDLGGVEFQVADPSKALDKAREAAITDAKRKAEVYARASGVTIGRVVFISEDPGFAVPMPLGARMVGFDKAAQVPVAAGEDVLHARVTVGFDLAP